MLYLNPPYYYIDGVSLLPDHEDPLQFYFMPLYPRFSTNPVTNDLQLSLLKYTGLAGADADGGFLNFDVNIGIDDVALGVIAGKLQAAAGLNDKPRLSPVPLIDGTVRLILLDQQTPVAPPAGGGAHPADPPARFVETILQATKPALYGDNQAVFSAQLSANGVTILEAALHGAMTPIAVVYDLDYIGLRPAFQVKLTVDWDRVFKYVDKMTGVDGLFVSTEISKAISDLKDQRAIVMESDLFVPEGEDASTVVTDFTRAEAEVREMFTDAFFTPSIQPSTQAKDGWDRAADFANQFGRYATTGGVSSLLTFRKKEADLTRIDQKSLNVNIRQRTAVRRSIHPQGHLGGIAAILNGDPSKYITPVNLDSAFFKRRRFAPTAVVDMAADQVTGVHVMARYGGEPKDIMLDPQHPGGELQWSSHLVGGVFQWPVSYDYEVTFKSVDTSQRPMQLSTMGRPGWPRSTDNENQSIIPREDLYTIVAIPIIPDANVFGGWATVLVHLSYVDEANGLNQHERATLTKAAPSTTWNVFVLDSAKTEVSYQITYIAADNETVEMPAATTTAGQIRVVDPFPDWAVQFAPSFDWTIVDRAFVDASYDDPANGVSEAQSFEFTANAAATQTFRVKLRDPDLKTVAFAVTILFKDGHSVEVPRSQTQLPRILLTKDMKAHRVVTVHPADVDFGSVGLTSMVVDLSHTDNQADSSAADTFTFTGRGQVEHFEYTLVSADKAAYSYRVKYLYDNGMSRATDATADTLDLSVAVN